MSSIDQKKLEKILNSLTLEDTIIILQLAELIVKKFERYRSKFRPQTIYSDPRSQIFEKIFEKMMDQTLAGKQQNIDESITSDDEMPDRIAEFVKKLKEAKESSGEDKKQE